MAINIHNLRVSNMTVGPLSGGGNGGGGGASLVTTGLLGHWDMGDINSYPGSGTTVTDLTGNGYDATMSGGSVSGTGQSAYFSGGTLVTGNVGNYFTFGGASLSITTSFWFRLSTLQNVSSNINNYPGMYFSVSYTQDRIEQTVWMTNKVDFRVNNFFTDHGTNWVNISSTADQGNFTFYVNGVQEGTFSNTDVAPTSSTSIRLLNENSGTTQWAQSALYNRALTASEVLQNFNALKSRYGY